MFIIVLIMFPHAHHLTVILARISRSISVTVRMSRVSVTHAELSLAPSWPGCARLSMVASSALSARATRGGFGGAGLLSRFAINPKYYDRVQASAVYLNSVSSNDNYLL